MSLCTWQPSSAFPASAYSASQTWCWKKKNWTKARISAGKQLILLIKHHKKQIVLIIIIIITILSTEPWSSLHSQQLPLFFSIKLESMKPDQGQNSSPHFLVCLIDHPWPSRSSRVQSYEFDRCPWHFHELQLGKTRVTGCLECNMRSDTPGFNRK